MRRKTMTVVIVAASAAAVWSCTQRRDADGNALSGPTVESPQGTRRLGEHWVQDEKLRAVMAQVSQHASRWPAGVPQDPEAGESKEARREADEAFRDAEALADGLADAAVRIPRSVADHPMSADDRRGFAAEARRLHDQAVQLRQAARGRKVEQMQRSLDQISSTCVSCHSQYRDFTGELGARKASAE